jgi:hypothetical protein
MGGWRGVTALAHEGMFNLLGNISLYQQNMKAVAVLLSTAAMASS